MIPMGTHNSPAAFEQPGCFGFENVRREIWFTRTRQPAGFDFDFGARLDSHANSESVLRSLSADGLRHVSAGSISAAVDPAGFGE
ncbi:MAG: hypothetical protein AABP62_21010 [Planctomycetota bacterium]